MPLAYHRYLISLLRSAVADQRWLWLRTVRYPQGLLARPEQLLDGGEAGHNECFVRLSFGAYLPIASITHVGGVEVERLDWSQEAEQTVAAIRLLRTPADLLEEHS